MHLSNQVSNRAAALLTAAASAAALVAAAAAPALATPAASSSWRLAFKVSGAGREFTAVTALSTRNAWAFGSSNSNVATAYHLTGSAWHKVSFPGTLGQVVSASASSASNVWAFGFQQAARYNGSSWSVLKKVGYIDSGLAVSSTSDWVFGGATATSRTTSAWHYDGSTWTKVASGSGLDGASAVSPASIWGYGGKDVAHWNGKTWAKTSVARLLPRNTSISRSFVAGIYAAGAHNVYAIGSGGAETVGGPIVVLHYNGSKWSRVAARKTPGAPEGVAPDGRGGLWIPQDEFLLGSMNHFSRGKLTGARLPYGPTRLFMRGVAHEPGSTGTFAVGFIRRNSQNTQPVAAVILRYGP